MRDFGVGIPAGDIPKLFTRFYRASTAGNVPGLGVGLHVVQSIMALQGGSVSIDTVLDRGTTVTLRLPRPRHVPAGGQDSRLVAAEG